MSDDIKSRHEETLDTTGLQGITTGGGADPAFIDPGGGTGGSGVTPVLNVTITEPVGPLPDPKTNPNVTVRFTTQTVGVRVDGGTIHVNGTNYTATRWSVSEYYATVPVPAGWPTVGFGASAYGIITMLGETTGRPIEGYGSRSVSVTDSSAPEIKGDVVSKGFVDSGSGFNLSFEAKVTDYTSGLAHMEYSLNGGAWVREAFTSNPREEKTWSKTVFTSVIGSNTVSVRPVDRAGKTGTAKSVTIVTQDTTPPVVTVTEPAAGQRFLSPGPEGVEVVVRGTAVDAQSGMTGGQAYVKWSLNGAPFSPVQTVDNFAHWEFRVVIQEYGYHTLHVLACDRDGNVARDAAGNPRALLVPVQVVSTYRPKSTDELLSPRAYLDALLEFCRDHITVPGEGPLSTPRLESVFLQSFGKLKEPLFAAGDQPVSQLRVAIEVLRRHLAAAQSRLLAAHWKGDEGAGTTLADASGSGNHGALLAGAGWAEGRVGRALSFDGTDDHVRVPHSSSLELGKGDADFSVSFWIKLRQGATGGWRGVMAKSASTDTERTFAIWMHPDTNRVHYRISTTAGTNEGGDSVAEIVPNAWTHVAYVKEGRRLRLYLNGTVDSEVRLAGASVSNTSPLWIGKTPGGVGIDGCIDDLRVYHAALEEDSVRVLASGEPVAAPDEAAYRLAAYEALLAKLGTSYEEVRLARGAPAAVRAALADRLGIALDGSHAAGGDELDRLFVEPSALTEAWLEERFGLARSTRRLEDPRAPEPTLLLAQRARLRALWLAQDHPDAPPAGALPLVDPDRVGAGEVLGAAAALRTARQGLLDGRLAAVRGARAGQATPAAQLAASVAFGIGAGFDAAALRAALDTGGRIDAALATYGVTVAEVTFLARVQALAAAGTVTQAEWDGADHLLVQVWKRKQLAAWRAAEKTDRVALSPDFFRAGARPARFLPWRASVADRREWEERLRTRAGQLAGLDESLQATVAAVEEDTLPLLRDALVATVAGPELLGQLSDQLTDRLLVDVRGGGAARTTRILQAAETIQSLVFSWRTGRFEPGHPAGTWTIEEDGGDYSTREGNFDREWQWMGSYGAWRAAMLVFLYPENILLPHLREVAQQSPAFRALVAELRRQPRLTPGQARDTVAAQYWSALRPTLSAGLQGRLAAAHFALTDQLSEQQLAARRAISEQTWNEFPAEQGALRELFLFAPLQIALHLQRAGEYVAALDWYQTVYAYNLRPESRKVFRGLELESNTPPVLVRDRHWLRTQLNPHTIAGARPNPYTRYTLMALVECLLQFGDSEFTRDTPESVATARSLYLLARELLALPDLRLVPPTDASQVLLPNPRLEALRVGAEAQLLKIRQGRNITGLKRQVDAAPGDAAAYRLPGAGPRPVRPTPYRFAVLMERSRQLAGVAQQIESVYLSTLEKRDAESYNLKRAGFDLSLARAGVELQGRRVVEAGSSRQLAGLQTDRAEFQAGHYEELLRAGLSDHEQQALDETLMAFRWGIAATAVGSVGAVIGGIAGAVAGAAATGGAGIGVGGALGIVAGGLGGLSGAFEGVSRAYATHAQFRSMQAGFERRAEEWGFQRGLASRDADIGRQQERIADDHVLVVQQEQVIARTQETQAAAMAEFLATKFTSVELYEWMSGVLGGVYRYFLQQATATAKLAEEQLAFERQQRPESIVQADYWLAPEAVSGESSADRQGLTGSARLLQDVQRLDQFAFENDRRKLNLTHTFSLAQLVPVEFNRFRESGVLRFATPTRLFDQSFPGHYLRLVKRVRTSVIALVPPTQGIRATLTASGISRVVIADGAGFQETVVRRDPEMVALTAPTNATGVFEMDAQADMLLPFESMGVDTTWELEMPRAANPIDYRTVADVLVTIEYTALHSYDHRQKVIQTLDRRVDTEQAFSLRDSFPDAWYELANPASTGAAAVPFRIARESFPPNVSGMKLQSLVVCFVPAEGKTPAAAGVSLQFPALPGATPATGSTGLAATTDGIISTRRGTTWSPVVGQTSIVGSWTLRIDDAATLARLRAGDYEDVLVVVGIGGETPAWT